MVSQKRLKGHGVKKRNEDGVSNAAKYGGIFLLLIMVVSIAGFALSGNSNAFSNSENGGSQEVPLMENAFQNSQTGETYWGAIIGGEQFIFFNGIDGYEDFTNFASIANELKTKDLVKVYVDEEFVSDDALYVLEQKTLKALGIDSFRTNESNCDGSTLIFTNNNTYEGNCLVFEAPKGEEAAFADILAYHLIK